MNQQHLREQRIRGVARGCQLKTFMIEGQASGFAVVL